MKYEAGAPHLHDPARLAPNDPSRMRLHVEDVGDVSVLVVDDFYQDPHYVRDLALSLTYSRRRGLFPGYEAAVSLDTTALAAALSGLVEEGCGLLDAYRDNFVFSVAAPEDFPPHVALQPPHVDPLSRHGIALAALVYLNLPHQCRGGTALYTHRRTGQALLPRPDDPELAEIMASFGVTTFDDLRRLLYERTPSTAMPPGDYFRQLGEEWQQTCLVEMKFNRLALYPSQAFHSGAVAPGDFGLFTEGAADVTLPNRRLTQTIFLEVTEG